MPELPDVEQFGRCFEKYALNKEIVNVKAQTKSLIKKVAFSEFKDTLIGRKFVDVNRRGKFLVAKLSNTSYKVVFHWGMTGWFEFSNKAEQSNEYAQVTFLFNDDSQIEWVNKRKLGKVYLVEDPKEVELLASMGPEPLEISKEDFYQLLSDHPRKGVKSFLIDQEDIAGIGNIYSDEILFQAKVDPKRKIKSLSNKEKEQIYKKINKVLSQATDILGDSNKDFPDSWLLPHRKDRECPNNRGHKVVREKIAGRPARYCPQCQT